MRLDPVLSELAWFLCARLTVRVIFQTRQVVYLGLRPIRNPAEVNDNSAFNTH